MENKKRKRDNKLDGAGKALVQDDSRTLQEQGRGFIASDTLGSYTARPRTAAAPCRTPTIYKGRARRARGGLFSSAKRGARS